MSTTKSVTKAAILAAAKRKVGRTRLEQGTVEVLEEKNAPVGDERQAAKDRRKEIKQRKEEIRARQKELVWAWQTLLKAAEFVRDVDGQEPSMSQLREAVAAARERADISDEAAALDSEDNQLFARVNRWRWRVIESWESDGFRGSQVIAQADTLTELLAKIESE